MKILLSILFLVIATVGLLAFFGSETGIFTNATYCGENPPPGKWWCTQVDESYYGAVSANSAKALACAVNSVAAGEELECVDSFKPGILPRRLIKMTVYTDKSLHGNLIP